MNKARELAASIFFRKHGKAMPRNEVLETVFDIIDTFNEQHWHDRNRYHERITSLENRTTSAQGTNDP